MFTRAFVKTNKNHELARSVALKLKTTEAFRKNVTKTEEEKSFATKIVDSQYFDFFFFGIVVLNSIVLAIPDFSKQDTSGNLVSINSWRNTIYIQSEVAFLTAFSFEAVCKIVAHGFIREGGYFRDRWNILDMLVIVSGWISFRLTTNKFITILRLVRVVRPLKAVAKTPSLKQIVTVFISSIPKLGNVFGIAVFAFIFFGTAGLCLFSGSLLHTRCRLTPFPVRSNWTVGDDFDAFRCRDVPNVDEGLATTIWTKSTSPWANPVSDCYWPVDSEDTRLCSFSSQGLNVCEHSVEETPKSEWRWCGSNYDAFGNSRFADRIVMQAPEYISELNWGHSTFDNLGRSLMVVVEVVVIENWTQVMYLMQDSFGRSIAVAFIFVVFLGSFITLNLILSSICASINDYDREEAIEGKMNRQLSSVGNKKSRASFNELDGSGQQHSIENERLRLSVMERVYYWVLSVSEALLFWRIEILNYITQSDIFYFVSAVLVLGNLAVLSIGHFPAQSREFTQLRAANFIFELVFGFEILLRLLAAGIGDYFSDAYNTIDFLVVAASLVEYCVE